MKKLLLLAFCLLAFPAFGQTLASPGGGSSATFPTICPAPVASGQILYDNAGACGGITGWTTNGTTTITGAASTTLAIGGATIGTNALAVTGNQLLTGYLTQVGNANSNIFGAELIGASTEFRLDINGLAMRSVGLVRWSSSTSANSPDVVLARDAANTLAQRNGVNAQTFNLYKSFTDVSNYSRLAMYVSGGGNFVIESQVAGTGANGDMFIGQASGTNSLQFQTAGVSKWLINSSGHFLASTDNTYDIGASGSTRPRNVYAGSLVTAPNITGTTLTGTTNVIASVNLIVGSGVGSILATNPSTGILTLDTFTTGSFTRVNWGPATASFPALKRSTTILQARLADDSAYAPVETQTVRTACVAIGSLPAAGSAGRRTCVTDQITACPVPGTAPTAGGALVCPVFDNGTIWVGG